MYIFTLLRNYYLILVSCIVLLLINVAHTNFVYFLPDTLQFIYSLPITYWLGLFLICILIVSGLYRQHESLTLVVLLVYINALPATAFEVPRFVDVYLHASGAESLLLHNTTTVFPHTHQLLVETFYKDFLAYSREFPTISIFLAIFKLITNIDTFLFLRIFQLLGITIVTIIIYIISRYINSKYAFLSSVGFVALYMFTTHFSPTFFAFIYYLLFILLIVAFIKKQQYKRNILVTLFIILAIFPMTNPTLDLFIILLAINLWLFFTFIKNNRNIHILQIRTISLIIIIGIIGWFLYNAESLGIERALKTINTSLQKGVLPTTPSVNHLIYNTVEYIIIFSVFIIGITYFFMINKIYKVNNKLDLRFLSVMFSILLLTPLLFSIPSLFTNDTAFITRNYALLLFVVPILFVLVNNSRYYLRNYKILENINIIFKILVIIGLILLPISRNGNEAFVYSPASTLFVSEYLIKNGQYSITVAAPTKDIRQPLYYYASINDKLVSVTHFTLLNYLSNSTSLQESYNYALNDIQEFFNKLSSRENGYVIVSMHEANHLVSAHGAIDYISFINRNLIDNGNIINSIGNIRIYKPPFN